MESLSRPVRVVHVLEATEGGTRRWLETVMLGLDPSRIRNSCICASRDLSFKESIKCFEDEGLDIYVVDMKREISPLEDVRAVYRLARLFRENDFDIIHLHSAKAGMLGRIAAWLSSSAPVIYTPHAFSFLASTFASPVFHLMEKTGRPLADVLMAVSESEAALAKQIGYREDQVQIVRNGGSAGESPCLKLGERNHGPTIGMVGALRRQKDPLTFIRACALLREQNRDARFCICGAGPLEEMARRTIDDLDLADVFDLAGNVDGIDARVQSWDVFVLPSRYEGLPYSLLDAMAASKPIVATRVPGIEEVIVDGESGLLVEPGDPEGLASAIGLLLDNDELARGLGEAARRRVEKSYRLDVQLSLLTGLYEDLARRAV